MNINNYVNDPEFKSFILRKARYCSGGNIKLGHEMLTWSKLMGNEDYTFSVMDGKECTCSGSCPFHCPGCYVEKSYYCHGDGSKHVINGHAWRTIAVRYYLDDLKKELDGQLTRKRKKAPSVRLDQSGEIETLEELIMHKDIAINHPETVFFVYTKSYDIVVPYILQHANDWPENFIVLISIWHELGINEYKALAHLPFIKAFVVNDGYDYSIHGIFPTTTCKAYNGRKLNHAVTCFVCKKCFDNKPEHKIIFCDKH